MNINDHWQGILPLSAASLALLQSVTPCSGEAVETAAVFSGQETYGAAGLKTDQLVLAPAHQNELLALYAAHRSHASHRSHNSHASHYSGSGYSAPAAPRSPGGGGYYVPATPASPPRAPAPRPAPVAPVLPAPKPPTNAAPPTSVATPIITAESPVAATNVLKLAAYKKLAAQGDARAQFSLAACYLYGVEGAEENKEHAAMLFELAKIRGSEAAKWQLDRLNREKLNTQLEQDPGAPLATPSAADLEKLATLKQKAAEGDARAQYELALCYLQGTDGAATSKARAKLLLELAAIRGNEDAKKKLESLLNQ